MLDDVNATCWQPLNQRQEMVTGRRRQPWGRACSWSVCDRTGSGPSSEGDRAHLAALGGATPADDGTVLAMLRLVLAAFFATHVADVRARRAEHAGGLAVPCHHAGGETADLGAVDVQRDAAGHLSYVLLLQTGGRAYVARVSTVVARFNAICILLRLPHLVLLSEFD